MTTRAMLTIAAQGREQLATSLDRAEARTDRIETEKKALYAEEDALAEELSEARIDSEKFEDSSWVNKGKSIVGSIFGFGDDGTKKQIKVSKLALKNKEIKAELANLKKLEAEIDQSVQGAVASSGEAKALAQHGLRESKDAAQSRNSGQTALGGGEVAGGAVLQIESTQVELANEIQVSAKASSDRLYAGEQEVLANSIETHSAALDKQKNWTFGMQVVRAVGTVTTAAVSAGMVAATPMPGAGMLAKLGHWVGGNLMTSAPLGAAVWGGTRGVTEAQVSGSEAKAATLEAQSALAAESRRRADKRTQAGLRMASEARETVSLLRDQKNKLRA